MKICIGIFLMCFASLAITGDAVPAQSPYQMLTTAVYGSQFHSALCKIICTKDPAQGGNYCNCDRYPL